MTHKRVCVGGCMCVCVLKLYSHPFTTITQTSQTSGSVPTPIHRNEKQCLHSDGYLQTDKLTGKLDLCFILNSSKN